MIKHYKTGFDCKKFEDERFGLGGGKMQWINWGDVAWYYGLSDEHRVNKKDLREGNMDKSLYLSLCSTFGKEQMDEYFRQDTTQPKALTREEREIEELSNFIVYGHNRK